MNIFALAATEINYPSFPGAGQFLNPQTIERFVGYIFYFIIFLGAILAVFNFIRAGFKFISSPAEANEARKLIISTLLGLLILFGSVVILRTINPNIINFSLPAIIPIPATPPETIIQNSMAKGDLLYRLKKMSGDIRTFLQDNIQKTAEDFNAKLKECNCSNAVSLCSCGNKDGAVSCIAQLCYIKKTSDLCKDEEGKIKEFQTSIFSSRDILFYYIGRITEEKNDLQNNIDKVVAEKINWYIKAIQTAVLNRNKSVNQHDKDFWQNIINELKKSRDEAIKERDNKNTIASLLLSLRDALDSRPDMPEILKEINGFSDKCFADIKDKCAPKCKNAEDKGFGCNNNILGCQPDKCEEANPCPAQELDNNISVLKEGISQAIIKIEEIIKKVDSISTP